MLDGVLRGKVASSAIVPTATVPPVAASSAGEVTRVGDVRMAPAREAEGIPVGQAREDADGTSDFAYSRESRGAVPPEPMRASSHGACPKCGSELAERVAKRGENKGRAFVACSAFPSCRYTVPG
jgi:hypothetical protein